MAAGAATWAAIWELLVRFASRTRAKLVRLSNWEIASRMVALVELTLAATAPMYRRRSMATFPTAVTVETVTKESRARPVRPSPRVQAVSHARVASCSGLTPRVAALEAEEALVVVVAAADPEVHRTSISPSAQETRF
jgi:hypothetical protein